MHSRIAKLGPTSGYLAGSAIQASAALLIAPVATRVLGPAEYGSLAVVLVVAQVLAVVQLLGFAGCVTRFAFDDDGVVDLAAAQRVMLAGAAISCIGGLASLVASPLWGPALGGPLADAAVARRAVLLGTASALVQLPQAYHRASFRVGAYVATVAGWTLLAQLGGLTSAALRRSAAADYVDGMIVMAGLTAIGSTILVKGAAWRLPTVRLIRAALRFGVPVVPHALGLLVIAAGDRIVIQRVAGDIEAGRYQVAYLVGGAAVAVVVALNNHWGPSVYSTASADRSRVLCRSTTVVYSVAAAVGLGVVAAAPWALSAVAGDGYGTDQLHGVVAIVAASALPYVLCTSSMHVVFLRKRTGIIALLTPAMATMNVTLNLVWVEPYGLAGAATATGITYVAWAALLYGGVRRDDMANLDFRRLAIITVPAVCALWGLASIGTSLPATGVRIITVGVAVVIAVPRLDLGLEGRRGPTPTTIDEVTSP